MKHKIDYRVYYEDTDAGGVMYHASYIRFCERGRTEFMRHLGLSCSVLDEQEGLIFVIRHLDAHYHKPARLEELLTVQSSIKELKNSSFVMEQSIFCQDSMLFSMQVTVVCVDKTVRPIRVPEHIRDKFLNYLEKE
jgi:acyl-CoA thioester hydrolase